jgi:50S ribosomal subunit-associated GTPase HflX
LYRCPVIIVGNKADVLPSERQVRYWDGQELAKKWNVGFVEISAEKRGQNVESLFLALTELYLSMTANPLILI